MRPIVGNKKLLKFAKMPHFPSFYSSGGLVFGIVNIVGNFGAVFADQSYWQSAVATKPAKVMKVKYVSCHLVKIQHSRLLWDS